jgi:hypothetical protein
MYPRGTVVHTVLQNPINTQTIRMVTHVKPNLRVHYIRTQPTYQCCGPGSGIRWFFDPWIRDDNKSGSGKNIPDYISKNLETIFGLKYLNSLMRIPGSFRPWIRDPGWKNSDSGSGINMPDFPNTATYDEQSQWYTYQLVVHYIPCQDQLTNTTYEQS